VLGVVRASLVQGRASILDLKCMKIHWKITSKLISEKLLDLANLTLVSLSFTQLISQEKLNFPIAVLGFFIFSSLYGYVTITIVRSRRQKWVELK
jgi:hypothetical protein